KCRALETRRGAESSRIDGPQSRQHPGEPHRIAYTDQGGGCCGGKFRESDGDDSPAVGHVGARAGQRVTTVGPETIGVRRLDRLGKYFRGKGPVSAPFFVSLLFVQKCEIGPKSREGAADNFSRQSPRQHAFTALIKKVVDR